MDYYKHNIRTNKNYKNKNKKNKNKNKNKNKYKKFIQTGGLSHEDLPQNTKNLLLALYHGGHLPLDDMKDDTKNLVGHEIDVDYFNISGSAQKQTPAPDFQNLLDLMVANSDVDETLAGQFVDLYKDSALHPSLEVVVAITPGSPGLFGPPPPTISLGFGMSPIAPPSSPS